MSKLDDNINIINENDEKSETTINQSSQSPPSHHNIKARPYHSKPKSKSPPSNSLSSYQHSDNTSNSRALKLPRSSYPSTSSRSASEYVLPNNSSMLSKLDYDICCYCCMLIQSVELSQSSK